MNILLILLLFLVILIPLWALFSSPREKELRQFDEEGDRPLRRRAADKNIEDETGPGHPLKRKEDPKNALSQSDDIVDVEDDFNLPFHPQEIIPSDSPFDIYRRTIANAETYMKRGDFLTARSLYEGVLDRVSDASIRRKLEDNLDYLNNYHQVISRRQELRRQKKDLKPQEIRLTVEGAESLTDRLQIGITPEKSKLDIDQIVEKVSDKISGLSGDATSIASQSLQKYKDELYVVRNQLHEMTSLKEQVKHLSEDRIQQDRDDIERMKNELSDIHKQALESKSHIKTALNENEIRKDIERREEENHLLRNRLDHVQNELSMLREGSSRTMALEQALAATIVQKKGGSDSHISSDKTESIDNMRKELDDIKNTLRSGSSHDSVEDLAGVMKKSMETLTPLLDKSLKNGGFSAKQNENKKDEFQLIDELVNGPKFDEPTDEDVLAKILKDAVTEHTKKNKPKDKNDNDNISTPYSKKSNVESGVKEPIREDFELVSDYLKSDDGGMPTDEEVMEKILLDTMKNKDTRSGGYQPLFPQSGNDQNIPRGFQPPVRKRRELPILRVSYNFSRLPDEFTLSIDKNHLEYSFYKFKPLLEKATDLVKRRKVKDAINYYKVVMDQEIPQEFKDMLGQNIHDLTEYLTKYYTSE
jgi:hypothetical protein